MFFIISQKYVKKKPKTNKNESSKMHKRETFCHCKLIFKVQLQSGP